MSKQSEVQPVAASSLHSDLALGLHALAQPLAILRAKLYLESISRMDADEVRQLAIDSAGYVERLCTLFNYLQELLLADVSEPKLEVCSTGRVLDKVFDGLDLWFADSNLALTRGADVETSVLADGEKLSQAISSLLMLVHGRCEAGDAVRVSTRKTDSGTEVRIESPEHAAKAVSAETKMALALVATILRKQNGATTFSPELSDLRLRVPNAPITS